MHWDVFVCHASEDKEDFVDPLVAALTRSGVSPWYDRAELRLGDSFHRRINDGLVRCRYGVVVLSHAFFAGEWPQRELDGLVARELTGESAILPVWHRLTYRELAAYCPSLAGRRAVTSARGVDGVAAEIRRAVHRGRAAAPGAAHASSISLMPPPNPIQPMAVTPSATGRGAWRRKYR